MPITPREALQRAIEHREIFRDEMVDLMRQVMRGEVSPVMTAAILAGLRVKKETVGEIAAAASVLREFARPVEVADRAGLLDIVGTGGDGAHTFNISTASAFVAAAAGARVAKHGNRSVSSKSGAADVLEALGARIGLEPVDVARCIARTGVGFMFAPVHHPAMKAVAPVRAEMGVRTLFNILGPLTNPAGAPSPPVPTMSTRCVRSATSTGRASSRITCAAPAISPTVSFLTRSPARIAAVIAGDTSPRITCRIRSTISSRKISRCSMARCSASRGVIGMVTAPARPGAGSSAAARARVR